MLTYHLTPLSLPGCWVLGESHLPGICAFRVPLCSQLLAVCPLPGPGGLSWGQDRFEPLGSGYFNTPFTRIAFWLEDNLPSTVPCAPSSSPSSTGSQRAAQRLACSPRLQSDWWEDHRRLFRGVFPKCFMSPCCLVCLSNLLFYFLITAIYLVNFYYRSVAVMTRPNLSWLL